MGPEFAELEAKVHGSAWKRYGRVLHGQAVRITRSQLREERRLAQDKLHIRR